MPPLRLIAPAALVFFLALFPPRAAPLAAQARARVSVGLGVRDVTRNDLAAVGLAAARGAFVGQVLPGSTAARAGLRTGDVVIAVNRMSVVRAEDLARFIASLRPGAVFDITAVRRGRPFTVRVQARASDGRVG